MEQIERPPHRLTVGRQQVEVIEAVSVFGIARADHDSVYGLRRHRERFFILRRSDDTLDG